MNTKLLALTIALGLFGHAEAAKAAETPAVRIDINTQATLPPIAVVPFNVRDEAGVVTVALMISSVSDATKIERVRVKVGQVVTTNAKTLVVTTIKPDFVTVEIK